jgi:SAM-dependent methyltransferase
MQASYSTQYRELWRRHWWWQSRHRLVMQTLKRVCAADGVPADERALLDIGCAGGVAFDDFSSFGNIRGIEPDTRLVDVDSPWATSVDITCFDSRYEPQRRPNIILMLDVLEHIEDDQAALESVHKLLVPGGTAILTVPALPSLWSEHDEVNLHFRRYTKGVLRERLQAAGLEIRTLRYMFGWPLGLMYARRFLAKSGKSEYSVKVPPGPINALFRCLTYVEENVCRTIGLWPFVGSSLIAVVTRSQEAGGPEARIANHESGNEHSTHGGQTTIDEPATHNELAGVAPSQDQAH